MVARETEGENRGRVVWRPVGSVYTYDLWTMNTIRVPGYENTGGGKELKWW